MEMEDGRRVTRGNSSNAVLTPSLQPATRAKASELKIQLSNLKTSYEVMFTKLVS